jgi:hypothetical protein
VVSLLKRWVMGALQARSAVHRTDYARELAGSAETLVVPGTVQLRIDPAL